MNCYKKLCTEFYDLDKPTAPPAALEFYVRYAERANGPILEPMCGTGRFLIPLLQRGCDIDGFDASPQMLAACREKLRRLHLKANVTEQSLPEIDLPRKYALVMIPAGSIGLIPDIDLLRASLKRLHDVMLPGATLVMEVDQHKPKESTSWPWGGRWIDRPDGARIIISWLGNYDAKTSISNNIHRYELIKDGQLIATEFEDFPMLRLDPREMTELLHATGFESIRTIAGTSEDEVVIECRTPGG